MDPLGALPDPPPTTSHSRAPMLWAAVAILAVGGCLLTIPLVVLPGLAQGAQKKQSTDCMLYLRQVGESMALYTADFDERLPPAEWMDAVGTRMARDKFLRCPSVGTADPDYGYALNAALVGRARSEIEDLSTALVFDTVIEGRNAVGALDSRPSPPRHLGTNHLVRIDGLVPGFRLRPSDEPVVASE